MTTMTEQTAREELEAQCCRYCSPCCCGGRNPACGNENS